jgi:signal transduction histidine kinase/DNA-binding response OmpR family regulator
MTLPLQILLVESQAADQLQISAALRADFPEAQIEVAAEETSCALAIEQGRFDVAIISYDLSWTDGLTVFRTVRARLPQCPIILCTKATAQAVAAQALKEGLDDYVVKEPPHLVRLPAAVQIALARTKHQHARQENDERVLRNATAQQQAEEQLRRYTDRLALLHSIDRAILAEQPLALLAQEVLQALRRLAPCRRAGVVLFDLQAQEATLLAVDGEGSTALPSGIRGPLSAISLPTLDMDSFARGRSYEISDLQELSDLPPALQLLRAEGVRTLFSVPLVAGGTLFGALNLGKLAPEPFFSEEKDIAQEVARQLAIAVQYSRERAARQEAEVQLREEAEVNAALARVGQAMIASLNTPDILQQCCQLTVDILGVDQGVTALWLPEEHQYVISATVGHAQEARTLLQGLKIPEQTFANLRQRLQQEEIVEVDVADPQGLVPQSFLAQVGAVKGLYVALWQGQELIGAQTAFYRSPRDINPKQKRLAAGIAHLTALALTNAKLLEELTRANQIKDDFVGMMSHELRTPLNIIMGYTDMLNDDMFGELNEEQRNALQRIILSTKGLLDIVSNVLDLDRLRNRRIPFKVQEITVEQLVSDLRQEVELLDYAPDVALQWRVASDLPAIHTDPIKLKIVLKNLVGNALKFTEKGSVTIAAQAEENGVAFQVIDTGIGIAPEHLTTIFEPFAQVDSSMTRPYGGSGLGLYIVHQLVDLLGGTVSVESTLSSGSTFRIWLPLQMPRYN